MKILHCDKCGHEVQVKQIVGTEFANEGFETLAPLYATDEVKDLCKRCFDRLQEAIDVEHKEQKSVLRNLVTRILS